MLGPNDRIVLDTNIVRGLIEGRPDCLNVPRLMKLKRKHLVSIADGAFGELLGWLRGAAPDLLKRVKPALERLEPLLDTEFPIIVGGSQRLALAGVIAWPARSRADESIIHKMYWRHLKRVRNRHSLTKKEMVFRDTQGRLVTMTPVSPLANMRASQDEWWSEVIQLPAGMEVAKTSEQLIVKLRREHAARLLGVDPMTPGLARTDLYSEFIVRRQREASRESYTRPKTPSSNAWFDADLLLYAVLPAIVCTDDLRFIRAVRQLEHEDRVRLMSLEELYAWLETGAVA